MSPHKIYAVLLSNWFCCNLRCFVADYAVWSQNMFCHDSCTFVWRKLNQKLHMWRKNYKYQVCISIIIITIIIGQTMSIWVMIIRSHCFEIAICLSKLNLRLLMNIFIKSRSEFDKTWFQGIVSPGRHGPLSCTLRRTCSMANFSIHCFCSLEPSTHREEEGGFQILSLLLENGKSASGHVRGAKSTITLTSVIICYIFNKEEHLASSPDPNLCLGKMVGLPGSEN